MFKYGGREGGYYFTEDLFQTLCQLRAMHWGARQWWSYSVGTRSLGRETKIKLSIKDTKANVQESTRIQGKMRDH